MQRREFIAVLGGAMATWPLAARAQKSLPRIGWPPNFAMHGEAPRAGLLANALAFRMSTTCWPVQGVLLCPPVGCRRRPGVCQWRTKSAPAFNHLHSRSWRLILSSHVAVDAALARKPLALAEKQIQKLFALHQCNLAMQIHRSLSPRRATPARCHKLCIDPMQYDNVLVENRGSHDHNIAITSKYRNDRLTSMFLLGVLMEKRKCQNLVL
jgi:hypothetical protein